MRSTLIRHLVLPTLATVGGILTVATIGTRSAVEALFRVLTERPTKQLYTLVMSKGRLHMQTAQYTAATGAN